MLHGTTKRSSGHPHSSLSLHFVARESGAGSLGAELSPSGVAEAGHASLEATAPALGARERPHAYTNVPSAGRQTWTAQRSLRWWSWPPLFLDSLLVGPRLPAELSSPPSGLCAGPPHHTPPFPPSGQEPGTPPLGKPYNRVSGLFFPRLKSLTGTLAPRLRPVRGPLENLGSGEAEGSDLH